ncbi:hypothetical protein HOY82DRAFT_466638, partial [Tuber indicum]
MPGACHEAAGKALGTRIYVKIFQMGLQSDCARMDSTTFQVRSNRKQADLSWKPYKLRPGEKDWPTLIIECAVSQSYKSLINTAHWWLSGSEGQVKSVLLISVDKAEKKLRLELWEMGPIQNRYELRDRPGPTAILPKMIDKLEILGSKAPKGALLTLKFQNIFLRPP